jgi:hypothetical protein
MYGKLDVDMMMISFISVQIPMYCINANVGVPIGMMWAQPMTRICDG